MIDHKLIISRLNKIHLIKNCTSQLVMKNCESLMLDLLYQCFQKVVLYKNYMYLYFVTEKQQRVYIGHIHTTLTSINLINSVLFIMKHYLNY